MTQFKVGDRVRCKVDVSNFESVAPKGTEAQLTVAGDTIACFVVGDMPVVASLDEIELIPEATQHPFLPTLDEITKALGDSGWEVMDANSDFPADGQNASDWDGSAAPYPWHGALAECFHLYLRRATPTHVERCTVRVPGEYRFGSAGLWCTLGCLAGGRVQTKNEVDPDKFVTFDITREERKDAQVGVDPAAQDEARAIQIGAHRCTVCRQPFGYRPQALVKDDRGVLQPSGKHGDCLVDPVPLDARIRAAEPVRVRHVWEGDDLPDGNGD